MQPYFQSAERIAALEKAATSWKGTAFMPNAAVKGAGVSCQKLAGAIYAEAGFFGADFSAPDGPMDWGRAHKEADSLIVKHMDGLVASGKFSLAGNRLSDIAPGDVVGFKMGGCVQHLGIVLRENRFVHCWRDQGVMVSRLDDATFATRVSKVWRPVE